MVIFSALTVFLMLCQVSFAQHPMEKRFASMVSESRLRSHVRSLVRLGNRWAGTPSGDKATMWVASKLEEYGLGVEIVEEPERLVFIHSRWTLQVIKPANLRGVFRNEWLAGFSPAVPESSAHLVDAESDRAEQDVAGAVVLTKKTVTADLYDDLVSKGASAIISYGPGDPESYSDWAMITQLESRKDNKIPLFNISYRNGTRLREELAQGVNIEIKYGAQTIIKPGVPKTVIGTLKGAGESWRVVCAHGDSDAGGPGADDNASGVAGVLELARIFAHLTNNRVIPPPREDIKFIVWGGEYHSAEHFVKRLGDNVGRIASVLNFDEIGAGETRDCLYFESNDIPHNVGILKVLNAVGEEYAGRRGFWEEATTNPSQGGTDSYVFFPEYLEELDLPPALIPSVTVYTAAWNKLKSIPQTPGWTSKAWKGHPDSVIIDYSPYYHSSWDLPALTTEEEPYNMAWAVKAVGMSLLRLSWQGTKTPHRERDPFLDKR